MIPNNPSDSYFFFAFTLLFVLKIKSRKIEVDNSERVGFTSCEHKNVYFLILTFLHTVILTFRQDEGSQNKVVKNKSYGQESQVVSLQDVSLSFILLFPFSPSLSPPLFFSLPTFFLSSFLSLSSQPHVFHLVFCRRISLRKIHSNWQLRHLKNKTVKWLRLPMFLHNQYQSIFQST